MLIPLKLEQARAVFFRELAGLASYVHEKLYEVVFPVYADVLKNRSAEIRFGQDGLEVLSTAGLPSDEGATPKLYDYAELQNTGDWIRVGTDSQGRLEGLEAFRTSKEAGSEQEPRDLDSLPYDPLTKSELEPLQAALTAWGETNGIKDAWLFDAALRALRGALASGVKLPLQPTEPFSMLASAPPFQVFPSFNGTYPEWDEVKKQYRDFLKTNQPEKPSKKQAENDNEEDIDGEEKKKRDTEKRLQAIEEKKQAAHLRTLRRNMRWLIQRHFLDTKDEDILGPYEKATGEELTTYAVSKAIGRAAKALRLTL